MGSITRNARKFIFILTFFLGFQLTSYAQFVGEIFSSRGYTSHEFWGQLAFSDSSRFSFFSYNLFRIGHSPDFQNQLFNYSAIDYALNENFGLALGGFVTQEGFSPVAAVSFTKVTDTWLVSLFPNVELRSSPNMDIFGFIQFRPKLTDKLKLFTQVIANSNFNFRSHNFSEQAARVGLDYRTFQFGFGIDTSQFTTEESGIRQTSWSQAFGLFVRKEF